MAFTDLLTSSRGPGFIGTIVAMIVIVGFGLLFLLVFDEGLQGGGKTIEATIRDNQLTITDIGKMKEFKAGQIEKAEGYQQTEAKIEKQKAKNEREFPLIAQAEARKQEAEAALDAAKAATLQYEADYRAAARDAAKGMIIAEIKVPSGVVYSNVKISKVDDIGIQITHSNGGGRIDFKDLPKEYQDKLGYDENLAKKAADDEDKRKTGHVLNSDLAQAEYDWGQLEMENKAQQAKIKEAQDSINDIKRDKDGYDAAIRNKKAEIAREKNKPLSKAPQMTTELNKLQASWTTLKESVPTHEAAIRACEKKIAENKATMDQLKQKIAELNAKAKADAEANASTGPK